MSKVRDIDSNVDLGAFTMEQVESNMVRCPDQEAAQKMIDGERRADCRAWWERRGKEEERKRRGRERRVVAAR